MSLLSLLSASQKAKMVKVALEAKRTPGPYRVKFDARHGRDFSVSGPRTSPHIIFSVPPQDPRFEESLGRVHQAIVDFRTSHASKVRGDVK